MPPVSFCTLLKEYFVYGRYVICILVLLSFSQPAVHAQNLELIERISKDVRKAQGKEKFDLLNTLAWEYRSSFPDSTIKYGEEALRLSRQLSLSKGAATSLNFIGLGNYYKGNYVRAYEYYDRALQEAITSEDFVQQAYANNNIGRLFSEQGMLTQSYPYFVKAESLFEITKDDSGLAYVYQSFASLYKTQKDFIKSELNYQRALKIRQKLGNTRDVMSAMVLIGKLYVEINQLDDALLYFEKADSAGLVINDALARAEIKILMAQYYLNKKNLEQAERLCVEGLQYILNFKNVKLVPNAYLVLGEIEFEKKNYGVAKKYFTIVMNVSTQMRYLDLKMQAHYFLWKVSEIYQNREDELFHSNQYLVLKDSIKDIDISGRIAKFQFQIEIERKQQENELLKSQEAKSEAIILQQNQQRIGLIVLVVFSVVMLYIQWRNARKTREAHRILSDQKSQIEAQGEEIRKQLKYIEVKHGEAVQQKDEINRINSELFGKIEEISQRNGTLKNHLTTLLDFSKSKSVNFGTEQDSARDIARLTAQSLSVSRVSVWKFNQDTQSIESIACYELASDEFKEKMVLSLTDYPRYAEALITKKIINAPDARTAPETKEFTEGYLLPLDIHSMLDATYSMDGHLGGLLCCEQQGKPRVWQPEDIIFASSVSDIISLTYRSMQRREYEKQMRQQSKEIARMNEMLEQRVKERTLELENQNKQLTEYAFINSHLLRSPVSNILGLLDLMEKDTVTDQKEMLAYLKKACADLDSIVKKITLALDSGEHFNRDLFKK